MSHRVGCGKNRKSWQIVEWLKGRKIPVIKIADELGVDQSLVSHTIHGSKNSRVVLARLVKLGCPKRILSLPPDMENAA
jgi:hypothetical protein